MNTRLLAFTERGYVLARQLAASLDGEAARCGAPLDLNAWTQTAWKQSRALVFVGAAGIAVRAIAPHVRHKTTDPAVVVVDECGQFAIPILSGHLGGANELARHIGALCGAVPVITTATDTRGLFAVDQWAKRQGCRIGNPEAIKTVSAKVLSGKTVRISCPWPVAGTPPPGVTLAQTNADARITLRKDSENCLHLVPAIAVLGVGCRRGVSQAAIESSFEALLSCSGLDPLAFAKVCSIDLKQEEPGLLAFCAAHNLAFETFSAQALLALEGAFSSSDFVQRVTGVDNVCERSAAAGSGGQLYLKKQAGNGVTMAVALSPFAPDWRWQDG